VQSKIVLLLDFCYL